MLPPPRGDDEQVTAPLDGGRRWASVGLGDIVGYTILMAVDEARTHGRWLLLLESVIRPLAIQHGGRAVDFRGDGVAAEFPDAAGAVRWATDVQAALRREHDEQISAHLDSPVPIALRIGLHAGLIIPTADNIAGDVVNVAARLQEQAQPGGVVLSDAVFEQLSSEMQRDAVDLGLLELRHVGRPVRAYAINTHLVRVALPLPRPPAHMLPSVAVLPLHNLSGRPEDDYFADGIVEDIIVSLSSLRELFVISRNSTLMFRGAEPDPRHAGRALGVRYVLMGNVRRAAGMRINLQLVDVLTGGMVWTDRIDLAPDELFAVQDDIVLKVVAGIAPSVQASELRGIMRRPPESLGAYDHWLRALHVINSRERGVFLAARGHFEAAIRDDPGFAMPAAWLARWYSIWIGQGWSSDVAADSARCGELAQEAIALDPRNALALATAGHNRAFLMHDCDGAMAYLDRAVAACPNSAVAWTLSSATRCYLGRGNEAVLQAEQGLKLSPLDQSRSFHYSFLSMAHYANGTYEDAVRWARLAISDNPGHSATYRTLIVSLAALGRTEEARVAGLQLLRLEPNFGLDAYEKTRNPFVHTVLRAQCMTHLRSAGLPD